jgi:hypothetical protein
MRATTAFFLASFLLTSWVSAQQFCGFDDLHLLHTEQEEHCNQRITDQLLEGSLRTGEVLVVPVVVHIIHNNGPENIADEAVVEAIEYLNDAFSNNGYYQNELGVNVDIQFCLAAEDPAGVFSSGIQRVVSSLTDVLVPSEEAELKMLSHWNGEYYLNVWVVDEITREENNEGVVGFATFPSSHGSALDGVVVEVSAMGTSAISTTVLVHEVGHYLGLYHTFQGGCPNDDCLISGDRICDTPPDASAFNTLCYDGTNSCFSDEDDISINNPYRPISLGGLGDQLDMQTNFMDYASLFCFERFTENQANRMRASLLEVRASLLEVGRCDGPCDSPLEVLVTSTELEVEVGEEVSFSNLSSNYTQAEWFLDGASQGGATAYSFIPDLQGTYVVSIVLEGEEPGCAETVTFEVNVTCVVTSVFTNGPTNFETGGSIDLVNESIGAEGYTWYVDGEAVSSDESPSLTFVESGSYTIQLLAEGSTCSVWSSPLNISVGTCVSGNEHNIWLFFNQFGSGYGLDFNTDPPTAVLQNNLPPNADHCKTTICDLAGNVLFLSTGTEVLNRDYEVLPNGGELLGNTSSHFGTMIVARPGSSDEFFVFHSSLPQAKDEGGLYYSMIDQTLDDGYGDVTILNQYLGAFNQEALTCVRHCNLVDFWLLTYDQIEGRYLAWLVTENGVNPSPVVSPLAQDVYHSLPITPNAKGDRIMHGNYLMDFDASSGALSVGVDFALSNVVGWEFSGSGRYLYLLNGEFSTAVSQIDLWNVDIENPLADAVDLSVPAGAVYFYPQRAPDGNIYLENALGGDIARIVAPNLPADQVVFDPMYDNFQALINSFGNYFHRYVDGESLFVEGETVVCAGESIEYAVYGADCLMNEVDWIVEGAGFSENNNGQILINFPASGTVTIKASMQLACGTVMGTLEVEVMPASGLDLGADFGTCGDGEIVSLDAGPGYASYAWSNGETGQGIEVSEPGIYGVIVDTGMCTAADEVEVMAMQIEPINLGPDTVLCDGGVLILNAGFGYNDYTWQDGTTGPVYTVFEGGAYVVSATVPCAVSDTIVIEGCDGSIGLGLEEIKAFPLRIAPNPNRGEFTLEWDKALQLDHWVLLDVSGQRVSEGRLTEGGLAQFSVSVAKGVYVIRVEGPAGAQYERLVID